MISEFITVLSAVLRIFCIAGMASLTFPLRSVAAAPDIVTQPMGQTNFLGGTAVFTLIARGTEPLQYQWFSEGASLPNETNSTLVLPSLRFEQAGRYFATVQDAVGTSISSNAVLTINSVVAWGNNSYGKTNVPAGISNIVAVAAGLDHTLALTDQGIIRAWGANTHNQLNVLSALTNVIAIAAGNYHDLALRANGTVVAWGTNNYGQTNVPANLTNVISIAAGAYNSLALRADGTVAAWADGQTNVPADWTNIVAIVAGEARNLALTAAGRVRTWGGDVPAGLDRVIAIAAGTSHSLALRDDGTLVGWGLDQGQLIAPPEASNIVAIAAGDADSFVMRNDGTIVAWGRNAYGVRNVPSNVSNVVALDVGKSHAVAAIGDARPRFTVPAVRREAASGTTVILRGMVTAAAPVTFQWQFRGTNIPGATNASLALTNLQIVQSGGYRLVVSNEFGLVSSETLLRVSDEAPAIDRHPLSVQAYPGGSFRFEVFASGSVPLTYQWLYNDAPLAGETNRTLQLNRVQIRDRGNYRVVVQNSFGTLSSSNAQLFMPVIAYGYYGFVPNCPSPPVFIPSDLPYNVAMVAGGDYHSLALLTNGSVRVWGFDAYCAGGPGGQETSLPPGLSNVVAIAAGSYHSLALRADGTVAAWGGHSGTGTGQTTVPRDLTNVVAVAAGWTFSVALTGDGRVRHWGLVGGSNVVLSLTQIVAIAAGPRFALALRDNGTVVAWGSNLSVTNVPATLSNVVAIAAGTLFGMALRSDGSVATWGDAAVGRQVNPPPAEATNVVAIAAGDWPTVLRADGTLVSWSCYSSCPPAGLTNVVAVESGAMYTLGIVDEGALVRPSDFQLSRLRWLTRGAAPWLAQSNVTFDGEEAFQSAAIPDGAETRLKTSVFGPGALSFRWKVSSEQDHDSLRFYLDGREQAAISGEVEWAQRVFALPPGFHVLEWVYSKNENGQGGLDAGWLDDVTFTFRGTLEPRVWLPPTSQPAYRGNPVTFVVEAGGIEPLYYQWQHNGTALAGATNRVLTLPAVQNANAGCYSVVISNAFGFAIISNACLALIDGPPTVVIQPGTLNANVGRKVAFEAITSGTAPRSYHWRFENTHLPDVTGPSLVLEPLAVHHSGRYSVTVSNAFGVATANASLWVTPVVAWGWNNAGEANFVRDLTNAVALAGGNTFSAALRNDGTVTVWGNPEYTNVPPGATSVVAIAAGTGHILALRNDGTVVGWGYNHYGQLQIPTGLSNVVAIGCGPDHSLAVKADGTVVAWGANIYGQTNVPSGLSNVVAVAGSYYFSVALQNDGRVVAWPCCVPIVVTNAAAVAAGFDYALALRADGTVAAWGGANTHGQTSVPSGLSSVVAISANGHNLALKADGTIVAWGFNNHGQVSPPADATNAVAVAAGAWHSLALLGTGPPPPLFAPAPELLQPRFTGGRFTVQVPTLIGKIYALEYKDSLAAPAWTALPMVLGDGTPKLLTDSTAVSSQRFYRVRRWR